jgi:hypothetical protein
MEIKRIEKQGIVVLAPQSPLIAGDAEHFGDVIHELGAVGKVVKSVCSVALVSVKRF